MKQTPEQQLVQRLWDEARRRPTHLRPGGLPPALRVLAILSWIGAAIMLAFGFIPGLFAPEEHSLFDGELVFRYSPIWPLLCGIAVGSGVAAVGYIYTATGENAPRHHAALAWCAGAATPLIPILVLAIDRSWQAIPAAASWLAAAILVTTYLHVRRRPIGPWPAVLLTCLVAAPWIPAVYANIKFGLALNADVPADPNDLLTMLIANVPTQTYVPGISLAFVAAMATGGVALAAQSRSAVAHNVSRHRAGWGFTAVLCAIAVGIIVLEVSGVAGISSGFLEGYWALGDLGTWPHAIIVAAAIAYGTQRSFRSPLSQRGDVATTLAIGVAALSNQIVIALVVIANLFADAITGPREDSIALPTEAGFLISWIAIGTLVPIAVRERWRGTVGQLVARVGLLFLVPVYIGVMFHSLGFDWPVVFWAKPSQVVICLTVIGCAATLFGLAGRPTPVSAEMANRLVLIPLLIVVGTSWLPNVIATPLTPIIAVTAALFALLWAMPPDSGNAHTGVVLTVSAQLLLVAAAAGVVTLYSDFSADDPTLALLLFAVPLSALLCAKVGTSENNTELASDAPQNRQ
ncbi:hypothetical protein [Mycolicibacterium frederiksbergense]|uniref:hypothetical protein n=1 Tax=Mycolicibacterium frederiksbergense TaxID=117567 RepID=UPI002474BE3E|nr:hypothetical protein [Mycolicibacterium frederiksbergense]